MSMILVAYLTAWFYVADNGTDSWTGDLEQVPAKYAEQAEEQHLGSLADYPRLSCVGTCPGESEED